MKFLWTVGILTLLATPFFPLQAHSDFVEVILRCSKPDRWVYRARHWVEISDQGGQILLRYGVGDSDQMLEIRLERGVLRESDGNWSTPKSDALELRFFQGNRGRYRLHLRERGSSSWPFRSDGFRCE